MDLLQNRERILRILEERTSINSVTGCWEYQGINKGGYGQVIIDHVHYYVHRISAVLFLGFNLDLEYLHVLHRCNNRRCWNYNHLHIGTIDENANDRVESGRSRNQNTDKIYCKSGHEFTEENTQVHTDSAGRVHRVCRECRKIYNRERYLRAVKDQAG